jgi:fucose 4-O-acetylase-like acetyltransferase
MDAESDEDSSGESYLFRNPQTERDRGRDDDQRAAGLAWVPGTGLRSREMDALKGCLIALIVFGHNIYLGQLWQPLNQFVYNFHVTCFLLLPFILPPRPLTASFAVDRAVRYLVPHYVFFLLACCSYGALFVAGDQVWDWLRDVAIAALVGSSQTTKSASGFQLYWFLPALLSLVLLRALWTRSGGPVRSAILLASAAVCAALPSMPDEVKRYAPMGILPALIAFPLGLASAAVWQRLQASTWIGWRVIPFAVWAAASVFIWQWPLYPRIGSVDLVESGVWELAVYGPLVIAVMVSLLIAAPVLARIPGLATAGRVSLQIFLIHGLIFAALRLLLNPLPWANDAPAAVLGGATFVTTLLISTACGLLMKRSGVLMRLVFPRDLDSWRHWRRAP